MATDTRWIQRYSNYHKACTLLTELTKEREFDSLSKLETEGLVQRFEYTFELAWKVLQDILNFSGYDFAPVLKILDEKLESLTHNPDYQ